VFTIVDTRLHTTASLLREIAISQLIVYLCFYIHLLLARQTRKICRPKILTSAGYQTATGPFRPVMRCYSIRLRSISHRVPVPHHPGQIRMHSDADGLVVSEAFQLRSNYYSMVRLTQPPKQYIGVVRLVVDEGLRNMEHCYNTTMICMDRTDLVQCSLSPSSLQRHCHRRRHHLPRPRNKMWTQGTASSPSLLGINITFIRLLTQKCLPI